MHEGDANLRLNVMDPRNESDILSAPGDFSAVDEDGEEEILQTYGMLNLNFEDSSGKQLAMSKSINVYLDPDKLNITTDSNGNTTAKLWWLDEKTGRWMQAGDIWMEEEGSNRSRRADQRRFLVTEITPAIQRFPLNLDISVPRCRVRVLAPPQSTIRLICHERQAPTNFVGYLEGSSNSDGVMCISAWSDKECYLQAEGKDSGLFLEPSQVPHSFPGDVAAKIVESNIGTGSNKIRSFKFITSEGSSGPVYPYSSGRLNCQSPPSSLGSHYQQFRFNTPNQSSAFTMENILQEVDDAHPLYWFPRNALTLQSDVCYIKVLVRGEKAVFLASSYRGEMYHDENARLGDFATIALDSDQNGVYVACLKIRCPGFVNGGSGPIEERTDVRITSLSGHCHFSSVSIEQEFLNSGGTNEACSFPSFSGNHQKWICVPHRLEGGLTQHFVYQAILTNPDLAKRRCLEGDNSLKPSVNPPVVTTVGSNVEYSCS